MPACPQGYISSPAEGRNEIRDCAAHKCLVLSQSLGFFYYLGVFSPLMDFFFSTDGFFFPTVGFFPH